MARSEGVMPTPVLVAKVQALRVLLSAPNNTLRVSDVAGRSHNYPFLTHDDFFTALAEMTSAGYVNTDPPPPWTTTIDATYRAGSATITDRGRGWLSTIDNELDNHGLRLDAARDAYLGYLWELRNTAREVFLVDARSMGAGAQFYDTTFTNEELRNGGEWLRDQGLIKADPQTRADGTLLMPKLTAAGERAARQGESVNDSHASAAGGTNNVTNIRDSVVGSVQMAGAGSTQTATTTITTDHRKQMLALAAVVDEAAPLLAAPSEGSSSLQAASDEVRRAAADGAAVSRGFAREVVEKLRAELSTRTASALAGFLTAEAGSLLLQLQG